METPMIEKRIQAARRLIAEKNLDALMVSAEENRSYLSGFTASDGQFDETAGVLFISEDKLILATDSRYELQAENQAPLFDIVIYKKGLALEFPRIFQRLAANGGAPKSGGAMRIGFESVRVSAFFHHALCEKIESEKISGRLIPTQGTIESLRALKTEDEIEAIRRALACAESAFSSSHRHFSENISEKEAAWSLEKAMRENGADSLSFPVIAAFGKNSARPHAIAGHDKIKEGGPLLLDWGAKVDGYCSDISRTIFMGEPDDFFKRVYMTVYDAQRRAIDGIRPGIGGKEVDGIARRLIDESEFSGQFGHGLGHGVGRVVHEPPRLSPVKDAVLAPGMVFTVEPGIYIPGWGGVRIENMVAVREDGAEVLNRLEIKTY